MNRWLIIIAVVLAFYLYTSRKKKEAAGLSDTGTAGQGSGNTAGTVIPSGSTVPDAATSTYRDILEAKENHASQITLARENLMQALASARDAITSNFTKAGSDAAMDSLMNVARQYGATSVIAKIGEAKNALHDMPAGTLFKNVRENVIPGVFKTLESAINWHFLGPIS